jgi:hypothetical protein
MTQETIKVSIKREIKPIIRFGLLFQGAIILMAVPVFLYLAYEAAEFFLLSLLTAGGAVFFLLIGKKYFENVLYKEYFTIGNGDLTVVHKTLWKEREQRFSIPEIRYFSFAGEREYTRHPMDNDVVDFTGLGTSERELQYLINDGTLEIETDKLTFRFGKNIPSWTADEIFGELKDKTGLIFKSKYPPDPVMEE